MSKKNLWNIRKKKAAESTATHAPVHFALTRMKLRKEEKKILRNIFIKSIFPALQSNSIASEKREWVRNYSIRIWSGKMWSYVCTTYATLRKKGFLITIVMMSFMNFMSYPRRYIFLLATVVPCCARKHNAKKKKAGSGVGVLMWWLSWSSKA